jgi:hypothetical protein
MSMIDDTSALANEANVGSSSSITAIVLAHAEQRDICEICSRIAVSYALSSRLTEGSLGTILEDATSPIVIIRMFAQGCHLQSCVHIYLLMYGCNVTHCDPLRTPRNAILPYPANDLAPCSCAVMRPACTAMRR